MITPQEKNFKNDGSKSNRSQSENARQRTAEFTNKYNYSPAANTHIDKKEKTPTNNIYVESLSYPINKKSLHSTPRNAEIGPNKINNSNGAFVRSIMRKDSLDSAFNFSKEYTPDPSPRSLFRRQSSGALYSNFSKLLKKSNNPTPTRASPLNQQPLNYTKQPRDNYFLKTKRTQPDLTAISSQKLPSINVENKQDNSANPSVLGLSAGLFLSARKQKPQYYSSLRKSVELIEEVLVDKPVASTISVQNLGITEKLTSIITNSENSERHSMRMRSLYNFLELIQNLVHIMRESISAFKLIRMSLEETKSVIQLFSKHPSKETIIKICNWVHLSRCYELNLKELSEACNTDALPISNDDSDKLFDEVQVHFLVTYLTSYVQDFEKLLHMSKQKITSEVSIRERDLIPRTIRQADAICKCISEILIDDFSSKKTFLIIESKNLINGLLFTVKQIRGLYEKIRIIIEECLEFYKNMFRQIKNLDKKANVFVENQKQLKKNLDKLQKPSEDLSNFLNSIDTVEHNVKAFGVKFTDGIDTLKKVLSFKLKVENVEMLFQMPQIEKKLSKHMDMLSQYVIRANPPNEEQMAAVFADLIEIPPIKNSFSLLVSYFQDLLKSQIYHELLHESFIQLKAIDDNVCNLYNMVEGQFETFLKNYFSSLLQQVSKQKRVIKNEYWKILTWSDFSNDNNLEASIARVSESVQVIKESISKTKLLHGHNYKNVLEKDDLLDENLRIWNEEVYFAENFIEYLAKITSEILRPHVKFNSDYAKSKQIRAEFDRVLAPYIRLRSSKSFRELCLKIGHYIRGKKQDENQDFLLNFEDSLQKHYMELFFKNFFSKLHAEFEKYFIDILTPIPSAKFEKLKAFIVSCDEALDALCQQYSIQSLNELNNLLQRKKEDLKIVISLVDQLLQVNNMKPKSLTSEDEAKIRSGSQSTLFKYLLESINSYEALHRQVDLGSRANELELQMQKLEEKVASGEFQKLEIEQRLMNLEKLTKGSVNGMEIQSNSENKIRNSTANSRMIDITVRITKLRRKMLKISAHKQLSQLLLLEDECKLVIHNSIKNRKDCYDIKVSKDLLEKLRQKIEEFKKTREDFDDNEVTQEILEDLENNVTALEFIGMTGEKLELAITGKLENLEELRVCVEFLEKLKDELLDIVQDVEFLDPEMRICATEQLNNVEIIDKYLTNAHTGIMQVSIQVMKNEQLYDQIRLTLTECFEINFSTHPAFKGRIYSPDLEDVKTEIGSIRSGLENLSHLLRLDNLGLDEMIISSYEEASRLHGWLGESLLHLFEDLVVITRLYRFLTLISDQLKSNIIAGSTINFLELIEKIQQAKDLQLSIGGHETELLETLREIDSGSILREKIKFIELELSLVDFITQAMKIEREMSDSKELHRQFEIINEKKSIADMRKLHYMQLTEILELYAQKFKSVDGSGISIEDNVLLKDLAVTFELFVSDIQNELRKGSSHLLGSLEDEFFLRLNPERLGSKTSVKESQVLSKILSEVRSIMRRKSIFESNLGAKYLVDVEFIMVYKTIQSSLICVIEIRMGDQNLKTIVISISPGGRDVKKVQELQDYVIDDCVLNYKLNDLTINT